MSQKDDFEARFLSGRELYGDDFAAPELEAWYADERGGYASLGNSTGQGYGARLIRGPATTTA